MKVTVVGCSGSYAGPDSSASCYLVEADDPDDPGRTWRLLLDLGSGALGALHRYADPLTIDGLVISHLHADHFFDISGYYVMRKYHPTGAQPRIPVWGPKGTERRVAKAYGLPVVPGMSEEFDFHRYGRTPVTVGPFTVTTKRMNHPVEAHGLRVEADGRSVVYSGDTAACDNLVELATDADLLLSEAAFRDGFDNPPDIHLTGSEAADTAKRARVGRLVLTHIPPWHDRQDALAEARGVFDGSIDLAAVGATYQL